MRDCCQFGPADTDRCGGEVVACVGVEVGLFVARVAACARHRDVLESVPAIETDQGSFPVAGHHPITPPGCHHPDGRWRDTGCAVPVASRTPGRSRRTTVDGGAA